MIDRLLFLARADENQVSLQRSPIDVRRELEAIREYHDAVADEQGVTVRCEGEAQLTAERSPWTRCLAKVQP